MNLLDKFFGGQSHSEDVVPSDDFAQLDDNSLTNEFRAHHEHLRNLGRALHLRGYHIAIDYDNEHVVRHGPSGGTHFFNIGLLNNVRHKVQISKTVPLRPFEHQRGGYKHRSYK